MATVTGKAEKISLGYECEFVERPPKAIQSECPLCLLIICKPHQVSCCGYSFCRVCIEKLKDNNKPCPTCNEENFTTFHDKRLQRSLHGFQVYCSNKEEGCEWKGELGQLDKHLNLSPQPDKQLEGCEYSHIECIYCSELIKRSNVAVHQSEHCDKRPFSCEYCHSYESSYENVIINHWPVCGYHPVRCPNECGITLKYQDLEKHVTKDCPETVITCDFHHVGCDLKLPRKDMSAHLNENLVTHMSLQAASHSKLLARQSGLLTTLQNKMNRLERENEILKHQVSRLRVSTGAAHSPQNTVTPVLGYVEFTMVNFEQHKRDGGRWYSAPFYTHQRGYKFCLRVYANGFGTAEGTHLSVFTNLMKGEFDDHLKWPFRGEITVQLVDQEGQEEHCTDTIPYTDKSHDTSAGRVTQGDKNRGLGRHQFFSHDKLQPKYLKNDRIHFRVTNVKIDNQDYC